MADTVAWQSASLQAIAAELRRQAANLRAAKDEMDGTVVPNTTRWTTSGSIPAQEYETARRKIDAQILEVSELAEIFGGTTDTVNDMNVANERRASQIVGLA